MAKKPRKVRGDITIGNLEKKLGLEQVQYEILTAVMPEVIKSLKH